MAVITGILFSALLLCLVYWKRHVRSQNRVPPDARPLPGPKSYPIVGRVHDIPSKTSWLKFYEWSKEFGPIYQTEMFGTVHVWISSERIANDLLSRRAANYSDRPQIPNLPNNKTSGEYLALAGRNDTWKRQRKLCQQLMAVSARGSLHDYPTKERDRFIYLLSRDSSQYREYIEQFTSRTVSRLSWGSPHPAHILRTTTFGLLETISPSGALPNVISWLMHVPTFMSPWKQKEKARHELEADLLKGNVQYVHDRIDEGNAEPSFIHTFINSLSDESKKDKWGDESEATYVVGQMAIAGALTIGSPIQSFILAMLHYPDWLRKLQKEIDEVCEGRCPEWDDRERLPMLRAVVKEVIRWRPPVPTGIPHAIEKSDVYNGYFIPAGATIHALEWAITRDEDVYSDADTFNPGRWLDPKYPTYKEPLTVYPTLVGFSQFGFGRRTCQGIPIVDQDLFLAMGGMAWAFDIRKKRRADGSEVPVHWNDFTPLLIAKPAPFEFDAVIRNEEIEAVITRMWETGKGEDDEEEEQNQSLVQMDRNEIAAVVAAAAAEKRDDDAGSDRGSDTSAATCSLAGSVSSSSIGSDSDGDSSPSGSPLSSLNAGRLCRRM
ncbi:cytochrome P450 [Hypoxylon trugodes]|uniref:cytochrome P450 n=1 Tax=Hypoxylon trugodes TaxID=326681 RepID=UPI0021952FDB|nr:cytochrome P450 [Hypoxylon trugodes]KAI1384373.1 cytochrome P450 [Hypoxylon trugodes]